MEYPPYIQSSIEDKIHPYYTVNMYTYTSTEDQPFVKIAFRKFRRSLVKYSSVGFVPLQLGEN